MDGRACRICLDLGTEDLISPCAGCRGSSANVHFSCMAEFYVARRSWWDLSCPTCKHDYEGRAAVDLGHIGLAEIEKTSGPDHRNVAGMLVNLGNAYGRVGDAARKRDLLERALEIEEREFGPNNREVAITLTNLGNAYGRLGDAAKQRDLLERALAIKERERGPDHREVAVTLTNLGNAYGNLGDAARMRDLLERALAIEEREYGPDHLEVAVTLTNLGNAYGDLGDAARMRDLLERALAIEERAYGSDHREVAITLTNLGNAHGNLGEHARMREMLERALVIKEREFGPDHLEVVVTLTNLAVAHGALREFRSAALLAARALRLARAALRYPNAIMADLSLCIALVRRAAEAHLADAEPELPESQESQAVAAPGATWSGATAELCEAVGRSTARDKVGTFAASATRFWTSAGRADVVEWLGGMVDSESLSLLQCADKAF